MNKYIYILLTLFVVVSCYVDKSTTMTSEYPDIVIVTDVEAGSLTYAYGETLSLSAEASQAGVSEENLEYLWEIDFLPGSAKDRLFLSDDKSIEFRVVNTPSATPYRLTLTVTNTETGFSRFVKWLVYVSNSLGEGVLVADTHDGGSTYHLDLLSSKYVTYGYTSDTPRVTEDLFSLANSEISITRPVTNILARSYSNLYAAVVASFNENAIMVSTDSSIIALDPMNYAVTRENAQLFSTKGLTEFGSEYLSNGGTYVSFNLMEGTLYTCSDLLSTDYATLSTPENLRGTITREEICCDPDDQGSVFIFDNASHSFYTIKCWCASQGSLQSMSVDNVPDKAFLSDKVSVATGITKGQSACFVLKGDDGSYWAVVVNPDQSAKVFELDAPEIAEATSFEFCDNADIFYYSTGKSVYLTVMSGASAVTKKLNWSPDSENETITMMRQYRQAWFGTHQYSISQYPFPLQYHRTQMMMVTWNESTGEGKIYFRPFNISTGMFSVFTNNGSVGGFGKITALGTTMR